MIIQVINKGVVIDYGNFKVTDQIDRLFETIRNIHAVYEMKRPGDNVILRLLSEDGIYVEFGRVNS